MISTFLIPKGVKSFLEKYCIIWHDAWSLVAKRIIQRNYKNDWLYRSPCSRNHYREAGWETKQEVKSIVIRLYYSQICCLLELRWSFHEMKKKKRCEGKHSSQSAWSQAKYSLLLQESLIHSFLLLEISTLNQRPISKNWMDIIHK